MKWIKGKPKAEDIDKVIMRRISNKLFVITQVYEYDSVQLDTGIETVLWEDVEWLDESDQFTPPVSNEAYRTPEVKGYSRDEVERMISNEGIKYCNKNHLGAAAYSKLHSCFVAGAMYGVSLPTPSTDEWVDVRKRLPEDGEIVWVSFINTVKEICQCAAWFQKVTRHSGKDSPKDDRWFVFPSSGHEITPTHWRKLAAPPQQLLKPIYK